MERDNVDDPTADPEAELRNRIAGQVSANMPNATPDPVYEDPSPAATPPPNPGVTPWSEQHPEPGGAPPPQTLGVTDPSTKTTTPGVPPPPPPSAPPPAPSAPAPSTYDPYVSIPQNHVLVTQLYQKYLGRDPENPDIINSWLNGQGGDMQKIEQAIASSPEAQAYKARQTTAPTTTPTTRPTGGNLTDPAYAAQYVAWAATQPGVNPSVKNDPGYWIGRFTSGAFGNDQDYALKRMLQAEGAPESGGPPTTTGVAPPTQYTAPVSTTTQTPQGLWNQDYVTQLRQMLMDRMNAAGQPVDPNDPSITAPLTAARDEATRTSDKERTALAENLYANGGLNTDAISQKIQQSGEKNALGLSSLRATLITREMQSRRDELKSLLQMAVQSGDAQSAQAIQMQMSELDAQVKREGLGEDMAKYQAYLDAMAAQGVTN